jgi:hypothetical protein
MKKVKIALGRSVYSKKIKNVELTLDQLYEMFEYPEIRNQKDGKFFIFASFKDSHRTVESLESYYGAALDLDDASISVEQIKRKFSKMSFCLYTTYHHKVKGNRYRIIIPYRQAVSPDRHREIATHLLMKLGIENIGNDLITQRALSRPTYLPACSKRNKKHFYKYINNARLFNTDRVRLTPEQEFELNESTQRLNQPFNVNTEYEEGGRNDALARLTGKFIKNGMDLELILSSAKIWNETNCSPPLSEKDVTTIVNSVYNSHKRNKKDTGWSFDELFRRINEVKNINLNYDELITLVAANNKQIKQSEKERLINTISQKSKIPKKSVSSDLKAEIEKKEELEFAQEEEKVEVNALSLKKEFRDWVYLRVDDKLFNTANGLIYKIDGFNRSFIGKLEKGVLLQTLLKYNCIAQCDKIQFNPEKELIYREEGITYVNSYSEPEIISIPGNVTPMLEHFEYLFPDKYEMNIIMDFIAFLVQRPGEKIRWMPIIKGGKGIGKSILADWFIAPILGRKNTFPVDSKLLKRDFNAWQLDTQLVIFHELKVGETRAKKLSLTESLKSFITDNYMMAHRKGIDEYQTINKANSFGLTNHEDAIMMTSDERRFGLFRCDVKKRPLNYYSNLIEWAGKNVEEILYYFENRDISNFNYQEAPDTQMTRDVKEGSDTWPTSILRDAVRDETCYLNHFGYCTYRGVFDVVAKRSSGSDLITLSDMETVGSSKSYILINAMKDLGFRRWQHHSSRSDRLRINGKSERIWIAPDFVEKKSKSSRVIRRELPKFEKTLSDFG